MNRAVIAIVMLVGLPMIALAETKQSPPQAPGQSEYAPGQKATKPGEAKKYAPGQKATKPGAAKKYAPGQR
jgi:hypothetical protein